MKLELKICERCGKLWFRPEQKSWAYCSGCLRKMQELPPVKRAPSIQYQVPSENAQPATKTTNP